VVIVLGFMISMQLWVHLRLRRQKGKTLPKLWSLVEAQTPGQSRVLVYIWSPSCGQCRTTTPLINDLKVDYDNVVSINAADHTAAVIEAGVMGTPSFLILDNGVLQQAYVGARSSQQIYQMLTGL
jgi:thioredoxin-like negative regulator of GroEL